MSDAHSIQVTSDTFETDILEKSRKIPVLVDFYAEWCGPCKSLGPTLEKLANDYAGAFILAKIDADAEQMLVAGMGVRSLPTVVLFKDGQPVDHFMGVLPEGEICALLDKYVEREEQSPAERAKAFADSGQYDDAISLYQLITADDPENHDIYLEMALTFLKKGDAESAEAIVERLPDASKMDPRAKAILAGKAFKDLLAGAPDRVICESRLKDNLNDSEAHYFLAVYRMVEDDVDQAISDLIALVKRDRQFKNDGARQLLIKIFDRLGPEDARARQGRKSLAAVLMV